MNKEAINRVQQHFNLSCKKDFRAAISRQGLDDVTFNFFDPITCNKQERTDEYCLAALVLGYKDCMLTYKDCMLSFHDINEITKTNPDLKQLLNDCNLYHHHKVEYGIPLHYIYTENGKKKFEILINKALEVDVAVWYIISGKCFDYNDEDIEYFCIRNDFIDYCYNIGKVSKVGFGLNIVEENLSLFKTYEKWWKIHNKPKYIANYNTAVKYINNFNVSFQHQKLTNI